MITEEMLHAYIDGELPPEDAARVVVHLADNPQDQARVDAILNLQETMAQTFDAPVHDPIPDAIYRTIMAGDTPATNVVPFYKRIPAPALWGSGIAAAAAVMAIMVSSAIAPGPNSQIQVGPVATNSALHDLLTTQPSGTTIGLPDQATLTAMASFATPNHGLCREVELITAARTELETAVSCRRDDGTWFVELATAVPGVDQSTGFVPASGDTSDAVGDFLDQIGADFAMTADEEHRAIRHNWTARP